MVPAHAMTTTPDLAVVPVSKSVVREDPFNTMLVQQFLSLTPKKYQELTGRKMSLPQKISLKLAQMKVKKMLKQGKKVDLLAMSKKGVNTSDFNIAGFLLGFFLSLLGVLIAYLLDNEAIIKWAWIGAGISLLIWLLAVLL
jgi:hypothetical protein